MDSINVLFLRDPHEELKVYLVSNLDNTINLIFTEDNLDIDYDKIDCIVGWRPELKILENAVNLRLFINPGTGVQHLKGEVADYLKSRGIPLINGHGNSYFTAQHAVAMLHVLATKIIPHHNWFIDGKWRRGDSYTKSIPLRHRHVGLLGYGAINKHVYKFLSGYDISFSILKRSWDDEAKNLSLKRQNVLKTYTRDKLHLFLKNIDILIIALPLTDETKFLLGKKELELLSSSTLLINVGRGDIIREDALYTILEDKSIAGAGIDVWYDYQPEEVGGKKYPYDEKKHPFHELDNVILSPHRAASPFDNLERWDEVILNLTKLANRDTSFVNQVNIDLGY